MMDTEPTVKRLSSGYVHIRWSANCWAQVPRNVQYGPIPDEHIFNPEWTRDKINAWWSSGGRDGVAAA